MKTPWHQDQPFYCIDGSQTISFWIPLDPVSRPAAVEFVAGTHSGKWFMPRSFLAGNALVFDEGTLEEVPDVEADRDAFPILGWEMQPGDAVAFNMLTLHAAGPADRRRRAVSFRLIGDDVRYGPRPHRTSPPFPGLEEELAGGRADARRPAVPAAVPVARRWHEGARHLLANLAPRRAHRAHVVRRRACLVRGTATRFARSCAPA